MTLTKWTLKTKDTAQSIVNNTVAELSVDAQQLNADYIQTLSLNISIPKISSLTFWQRFWSIPAALNPNNITWWARNFNSQETLQNLEGDIVTPCEIIFNQNAFSFYTDTGGSHTATTSYTILPGLYIAEGGLPFTTLGHNGLVVAMQKLQALDIQLQAQQEKITTLIEATSGFLYSGFAQKQAYVTAQTNIIKLRKTVQSQLLLAASLAAVRCEQLPGETDFTVANYKALRNQISSFLEHYFPIPTQGWFGKNKERVLPPHMPAPVMKELRSSLERNGSPKAFIKNCVAYFTEGDAKEEEKITFHQKARGVFQFIVELLRGAADTNDRLAVDVKEVLVFMSCLKQAFETAHNPVITVPNRTIEQAATIINGRIADWAAFCQQNPDTISIGKRLFTMELLRKFFIVKFTALFNAVNEKTLLNMNVENLVHEYNFAVGLMRKLAVEMPADLTLKSILFAARHDIITSVVNELERITTLDDFSRMADAKRNFLFAFLNEDAYRDATSATWTQIIQPLRDAKDKPKPPGANEVKTGFKKQTVLDPLKAKELETACATTILNIVDFNFNEMFGLVADIESLIGLEDPQYFNAIIIELGKKLSEEKRPNALQLIAHVLAAPDLQSLNTAMQQEHTREKFFNGKLNAILKNVENLLTDHAANVDKGARFVKPIKTNILLSCLTLAILGTKDQAQAAIELVQEKAPSLMPTTKDRAATPPAAVTPAGNPFPNNAKNPTPKNPIFSFFGF